MKVLFNFIDSNQVSIYRSLGFNIILDDPSNNIFYAEINFEGFDMQSILSSIEDCIRYSLDPALDYEGKIYPLEEAYELIDSSYALV